MSKKLMKLNPKFAEVLSKSPKDFNTKEIQLMDPLSKYNHWMKEGRTLALELKSLSEKISRARTEQRRRELTEYYKNKYSCMMIYVERAQDFLKQANLLLVKQEQAEAKAKAEREAKAAAAKAAAKLAKEKAKAAEADKLAEAERLAQQEEANKALEAEAAKAAEAEAVQEEEDQEPAA